MSNIDYNDLTDEELITLLRGGEAGVEDYLLNKYKPLVSIIAGSLYIEGGDRDDLIQEGMIGLFKAIREYDSGRAASFKTFAGTCIQHNMLTAIASAKRKKHSILNESVSLSDLEESPGGPVLRGGDDPANILMQKEAERSLMDRIKGRLSSMESRILDLYIGGYSYKVIAGTCGISEKSVDNALQRIRKKVRSLL